MMQPDDAMIERAARRALSRLPPEPGASVLAAVRSGARPAVLVATDLDGRLRCRSLVSFRFDDGDLVLDSISSDVAPVDEPELLLGPSHLAEDVADLGSPQILAIRHSRDVEAVLDARGDLLASTSGTGFVLVLAQPPLPTTIRARLRDGSLGDPLVVDQVCPGP